jgi:hypothetical protein
MSSPTTACDHIEVDAPRRRPLEYQRNIGSDMSMMFFVTPASPFKFSHPGQHLIKGLDAQAFARAMFPKPTWMTDTLEYRSLAHAEEDDGFSQGFFSLNMSLYNKAIIASEWEGMWFFMHGRVHPYALTWEVEPDSFLGPTDGPQEYCIHAVIVRDLSYQASV